jgi:hypothetical protein
VRVGGVNDDVGSYVLAGISEVEVTRGLSHELNRKE